jgi:hypothetical protein
MIYLLQILFKLIMLWALIGIVPWFLVLIMTWRSLRLKEIWLDLCCGLLMMLLGPISWCIVWKEIIK